MQLAAGFRSQIGRAMRSPKFVWSGLLFLLAVITATVADARSAKPQAALPDDANQLVREAVHNELNGEGKDHTHWRYHLHREDERGSQDREVIETKDGSLAKTLLINGRPLSVRWAAERVPAIVEAWQPGESGAEAIADVLFGDYNPSGRLPITIPRSVGQLPAYYSYPLSKAYWIEGGWTNTRGYVDMPATPLYPFGYGLSYTDFRYSNLRTKPSAIHTDGKIQVSVDVENTGKRAGVETVQLYLRQLK